MPKVAGKTRSLYIFIQSPCVLDDEYTIIDQQLFSVNSLKIFFYWLFASIIVSLMIVPNILLSFVCFLFSSLIYCSFMLVHLYVSYFQIWSSFSLLWPECLCNCTNYMLKIIMKWRKVLLLFLLCMLWHWGPERFVLCSVAKSCPTLCNPINCGTPGSSVLHYLSQFAQIHVHCVGDAI